MSHALPNEAPKAASTARNVDAAAVARVLGRWAAAAEPPWLHAEVARRMAERLPVIRSQPEAVLQWWAHAGASDALLRQTYPKARQLQVEPTPALLARSRQAGSAPWWSARRWASGGAQVLGEAEVPAAAGGLLWANMVLHAAIDPPALLSQWRRALAVDGFLMFSTLGPDTLRELHALYADLGAGSPGAPLVDMHDIGDMLVHAGFADPVMDQEQLTLTWATPEALLAELRQLGGNADPARAPGLRTPRWHHRLKAALAERAGADGRIAMRFEVVYGHAFNPAPRPAVAAQTAVSLDDMRAMVRAGGRPPRKPSP
ncbi:biotin synthase [Aquincola tertiaricarbonis]|uniref:biotin synthase n=1 Tax=Aquincola tertiaricarbonis TaxID=391953 RepID=UPI000614EE5E|nr:biotin synthase [Aquincola tertiaricarbonis]